MMLLSLTLSVMLLCDGKSLREEIRELIDGDDSRESEQRLVERKENCWANCAQQIYDACAQDCVQDPEDGCMAACVKEIIPCIYTC